MRSPRAASCAAKLLILLALGGLAQTSGSQAATKCPSGQILRVSLGICVPKAQNLAIMSKHDAKKLQPAGAEEDTPSVKQARAPRDAAANADGSDKTRLVDVAERDTPPAQEQAATSLAPQVEPPSSPFGSLFVGAFRSTLSAGLSAFR
jgi:hypothetical protein